MSLRNMQALFHFVLIIACFFISAPFVWTFLSSLKYFKDIVSGSWRFVPTFINYYRLFIERGFSRLLGNSVIVGLSVTFMCLAIGLFAAYSLSRFRWSLVFKSALLGWVLFVNTIPPISVSGSLYLMMQKMNVYNKHLGLILAHWVLTMPFALWMIMSILDEVPREVEEMSMIDGCTRVGSVIRIVLPLSAPALAAAAVLTFVFSWNEFLFALILTSTPEVMTIPVGIAGLVQEYSVRYGEMAAAAFFATVPMIIFVALVQRYLISGLTMGALKE